MYSTLVIIGLIAFALLGICYKYDVSQKPKTAVGKKAPGIQSKTA